MRSNPPLPAVLPNVIIRVTVQIGNQGQVYENILDYMSSAPVGLSLGSLFAFYTAWQTLNETSYLATLATDSVIQAYTFADVVIGTTPTLVEVQTGKIGTVSGDSLPSTVAAIFTKYTAIKGQHGRGRAYMGPIPITFTTPGAAGNQINATGVAAYAPLRADLLTAVPAIGVSWNLCVSTRPTPPNTLVANAALVQVMPLELNTGNVRRRRIGRGQ